MTTPSTPSSVEAAYSPNASVRPAELATAIAFIMLAMVLRWAPSRARAGSGQLENAVSSAAKASVARRPTARQALGAVFAGCAVDLFIGGPGGLFCGLMSTVGVLVFGSRQVSERETRAQLRLVAAAPPVVDLFAAGLTAGLLPADAAAAAANAFSVPEAVKPEQPDHGDLGQTGAEQHLSSGSTRFSRLWPRRFNIRPRRLHIDRSTDPTCEIAQRFAAAAQALRRGVDPEEAWHPLAVDGATAPVAAAALRASRTGAPASETVVKAARDLWNGAEQAAQARLRSAAVRAAFPLTLCFLPAFVLVGIAPTALALYTELRP